MFSFRHDFKIKDIICRLKRHERFYKIYVFPHNVMTHLATNKKSKLKKISEVKKLKSHVMFNRRKNSLNLCEKNLFLVHTKTRLQLRNSNDQRFPFEVACQTSLKTFTNNLSDSGFRLYLNTNQRKQIICNNKIKNNFNYTSYSFHPIRYKLPRLH